MEAMETIQDTPGPGAGGMWVVDVFPTRLGLESVRRSGVTEKGVWDGRRSMTSRTLQERLFLAARKWGRIAGPVVDDIALSLLMVKACSGPASSPDMARLSVRTRVDLLHGLYRELPVPLADMKAVLERMAAEESRRLRLGAVLLRRLLDVVAEAGMILPQEAMQAALDILEGPHARDVLRFVFRLPPGVQPSALCFRFHAVRWPGAFQARLWLHLARLTGPRNVQVMPTLPREYGADTLFERLAGVLADADAEMVPSSWVQDLGDAFSVRDPDLARGVQPHVDFSCSAGRYGEIEDLARRIRFEIREHRTPPHEIALVVRDVGAYSDAIADVFERFQIPCFFRRGVAAASIPVVKTVLRMADFRAAPSRDAFCALLESRWLTWPQLRGLRTPQELADDIRRAGVAPACEDIERDFSRRLLEWYRIRYEGEGMKGTQLPEAARRAAAVWQRIAEAPEARRSPGQHAAALLRVLRECGLEESFAEVSGGSVDGERERSDAMALNAAGRQMIEEVLGRIRSAPAGGEMTAEEFAVLLADIVRDRTVPFGRRRPDGVHVLNPYDIAGLRFRVVMIAGLNAGEFPPAALMRPVIPDEFRDRLHVGGGRSVVPKYVLPDASTRGRQEDVLFLTAVAAAEERLVLSWHACDTDGTEMAASPYLTALWQLAGWAAPGAEPSLSGYNRWRIERDDSGLLAAHYEEQRRCPAPWQRVPLPGESFRATVPLAFCCAYDEARQRVCVLTRQGGIQESGLHVPANASAVGRYAGIDESTDRIVRALEIEIVRHAFFAGGDGISRRRIGVESGDALPSVDAAAWLGGVRGLLAGGGSGGHGTLLRISPTAVETLARCPFRYLVEKRYRVDPLEAADFEPDPRDAGTLVHLTMQVLGRFLAGEDASVLGLSREIERRWAGLRRPMEVWWDAVSGWRIGPWTGEGVRCVVPDPERVEAYVELANAIFGELLRSGEGRWNLGDPRLRPLRERRLQRCIENLVRVEVGGVPESAGGGRGTKKDGSPALPWLTGGAGIFKAWVWFEKRFEVSMSVRGESGAGGATGCRMVGKIDRLDLIFEECETRGGGIPDTDAAEGCRWNLAAVRVVDYKGGGTAASKVRNMRQFQRDICTALDSQLPTYALAARSLLRKRFPSCPDFDSDVFVENVYVQYVGYHIRRQYVVETIRKAVTLSAPAPEEFEEGGNLLTVFLGRLAGLLGLVGRGTYPPSPVECDYCRMQGLCRIPRRHIRRWKQP